MVKRYEGLGSLGLVAKEDAKGDYVLFADYDSLERELQAEKSKVKHYEDTVCTDYGLRMLRNGVSCKEVSTEKVGNMMRERDGLREALGNLLKECERSFDWQYDPEFTKAYNEAWELHSKGAGHER